MPPQSPIPITNHHSPQIRLPRPPQHLRKIRIIRNQKQPINPSTHRMNHLPLQGPIRRLRFILHRLNKHPRPPQLRRQPVPHLRNQQRPRRLIILMIPAQKPFLETVPFLFPLQRLQPVQLLLTLALVQLLEVLLQVHVGLALSPTHPTRVGLRGCDHTLPFEDVEVPAFPALV
ncbi:hypothetical protein V8G54_036321 [Vigna mungo]|uniref:Uncharacterized protein n=1 Tax=Vigna mungo TaxID=3915 RepID=A0AAQ3RFG9_VIGMU